MENAAEGGESIVMATETSRGRDYSGAGQTIPGSDHAFRQLRAVHLQARAEGEAPPAGWATIGGQQRMIEIGRTLMGEPKVLLVDEPTAGLSKMYAEEVYQMLCDLRDRDNLGILLVDQEIRHALRIADYVYVLELGRTGTACST
jgi:ABC-type branched-subunit amino acid transport system ATPase component